jgi:hypothetical protein
MPNTIVPAIPTPTRITPTRASSIVEATRAGLSERQSAASMIENATSAAMSANAARRWSARIQSLSSTAT